MVQFGRTVARLRELNYRVMDYQRLTTILESRSDMWQDSFATLLQEEIVHLKITTTVEEDDGVPDEVAEILGDVHDVCGSKRDLVSFVNSEACRKIIKKYHKILLEEQAAGKDVSRAGQNESLLYRSICELQTLYSSTDMPLMSTETAQHFRGARASVTVVSLFFFGVFCCVVAFEPILVTIAAAQSEHVNSKPLTPSSLSNNICSFWSASVFFCSSPSPVALDDRARTIRLKARKIALSPVCDEAPK